MKKEPKTKDPMCHYIMAIPRVVLLDLEIEYCKYRRGQISSANYEFDCQKDGVSQYPTASVGYGKDYESMEKAFSEMYLRLVAESLIVCDAYSQKKRFFTSANGPDLIDTICMRHIISKYRPINGKNVIENTTRTWYINPTIDDIIAGWALISICPSQYGDEQKILHTYDTILPVDAAESVLDSWRVANGRLMHEAELYKSFVDKEGR